MTIETGQIIRAADVLSALSTKANSSNTIVFSNDLPIFNNNPGLAQTYFGSTTISARRGFVLNDAGGKIGGHTRGWDRNSTVLSILANEDPRKGGGGQGNFHDFTYRRVYAGQDSSALNVQNRDVMPVASNRTVASFTTVPALDFAGAGVTLYRVNLASPLGSATAALIAHPMRVETNNRFFGYVPPAGLRSPDGTPLATVDPAGAWFLVDNWTRGAPFHQAGPNVLPSTFGQTGTDAPLPSYTVTIDVIRLVEDIYMGWALTEGTPSDTAHNIEITNVNNKLTAPAWNIGDPLGDSYVTTGLIAGVQNDDGLGCGLGGMFAIAVGGWKRGFVARNPQTPNSGSTYGFLNVNATWGYYSTAASGFVLASDPGGLDTAESRTFLLDVAGNMFTRGSIEAIGNLRARGVLRVDGLGTGNDSAFDVFRGAGRVFNVGATDGTLYTAGSIGLFGTSPPLAKPVAPTTVAEIVVTLRSYGLCQ